MTEQSMADKTPRSGGESFFTTPLLLIFVTVFIDLIGFGMVIPILPFYAETPPFNATPFEIGILFSLYSWMQFFFSPILGRLSDRFGRRPILFISLLGSAVGYFVMGLANTLALVFLGRIIGGVTGANISTAQAYVADVTTRENRAKGMGLFGAAFGLGFILGPAIAGVLSKYGVHVPFFVAGVLSLVSGMAVYFLLPETRKPGAETVERSSRFADIIDSLRERNFGLINLIYFLLVTAFSIMTYAFVLYTAFRFGYNAEQNGYLFFFVGFVSVLGQGILFERLVRKFGETPLAAVGCFLMFVSLFLMPYAAPEMGGLAGLLAVCGAISIGNALASPALTSLASKITHEERQGSAMGVMQSGASLARAIGPMIGGVLLNNAFDRIDNITVFRTFWSAAFIMFAAFLIAVYSVKIIRQIPVQG